MLALLQQEGLMAEIGRNWNKAFDAGRDAFHKGYMMSDNPYRSANSRKAWNRGWMRSEYDQRLSDVGSNAA